MRRANEVVCPIEHGYRDGQEYQQERLFYLGSFEVSKAVDVRADKSDDPQLAVFKLQAMRNLLIAGGAGEDDSAVDKVNEQFEAEIEALNKNDD